MNREVEQEFYARLYEQIKTDSDITDSEQNSHDLLQSEVANLKTLNRILIDNAETRRIIENAALLLKETHDKMLVDLEADLRRRYPIRSLINRWIRERLRSAREEFSGTKMGNNLGIIIWCNIPGLFRRSQVVHP